jgi:hypothetical protein
MRLPADLCRSCFALRTVSGKASGRSNKPKKSRSQRQVGETAGHDQAFVIGFRRKRHHQHVPVIPPGLCQAAGFVAGDNQVPVRGF